MCEAEAREYDMPAPTNDGDEGAADPTSPLPHQNSVILEEAVESSFNSRSCTSLHQQQQRVTT